MFIELRLTRTATDDYQSASHQSLIRSSLPVFLFFYFQLQLKPNYTHIFGEKKNVTLSIFFPPQRPPNVSRTLGLRLL